MKPNTTCSTCCKPIYRLPCRLKRHDTHYCSNACHDNYRYIWIGYAVQMAGKVSREDIAAHIGIPFNTFKMWVRDFIKVGIRLPHYMPLKPPKEKAPKVRAAPKPKEPKYSKSIRKTAKVVRRFPDRKVDEAEYQYVKVDNKTYVLRKKQL